MKIVISFLMLFITSIVFGNAVTNKLVNYYVSPGNVDIRIVDIDGHRFVVASSMVGAYTIESKTARFGRGTSVSIIHSPSCQCYTNHITNVNISR